MQKDSIHYGGWEHRDVHNINGMLFVSRQCLSSSHCISLCDYSRIKRGVRSTNVQTRPKDLLS